MNFNILDKKEYTSIELEKFEKDGIYKVDVLWHSDTPIVPEKFSVRFSFASVDCYSVFSPALRNGRSLERNYFPQETNSRLASWMPLHSIVSLSGKNRATIALSDATTPTSISTGVTEYGAQMECTVNFFTIPTTAITDYKATIYVDMRDIPYYDSVYDVVEWWEKECGYSYCGDWKVAKSKIPDMSQFIERIHETGMKAMLWYSVPYVGINSENYERFKDMLLKTGKEDGKVTAANPEALYSYACATLGNKSVITAYCNVCLEVKTDIAVIVNAAATEKIAVKGAIGKNFKVVDCMGSELCKGTISYDLEEVPVPLSGMIFIN